MAQQNCQSQVGKSLLDGLAGSWGKNKKVFLVVCEVLVVVGFSNNIFNKVEHQVPEHLRQIINEA